MFAGSVTRPPHSTCAVRDHAFSSVAISGVGQIAKNSRQGAEALTNPLRDACG